MIGDLDLDDIEERARAYFAAPSPFDFPKDVQAARLIRRDLPALLEENRRLRMLRAASRQSSEE